MTSSELAYKLIRANEKNKKIFPWASGKKKFPFSLIGAPDREAFSFSWLSRCEGTDCHGCFANVRGKTWSCWRSQFEAQGEES